MKKILNKAQLTEIYKDYWEFRDLPVDFDRLGFFHEFFPELHWDKYYPNGIKLWASEHFRLRASQAPFTIEEIQEIEEIFWNSIVNEELDYRFRRVFPVWDHRMELRGKTSSGKNFFLVYKYHWRSNKYDLISVGIPGRRQREAEKGVKGMSVREKRRFYNKI